MYVKPKYMHIPDYVDIKPLKPLIHYDMGTVYVNFDLPYIPQLLLFDLQTVLDKYRQYVVSPELIRNLEFEAINFLDGAYQREEIWWEPHLKTWRYLL